MESLVTDLVQFSNPFAESLVLQEKLGIRQYLQSILRLS